MRKMRRVTAWGLAALMAVTLMAFPVSAAAAAPDELQYEYEYAAELLYSLGLFKGTENGFELERIPNRTEASVMLIRLLGKESAALASTAQHPFTDVPAWADRYIAYMYDTGLTKGVSADRFDASSDCTAKMFATFTLRALGYSDAAGDFSYDASIGFARMESLITTDYMSYLAGGTFTRGDMVMIAAVAVFSDLKGSDRTMLEKLMEEQAVSADQGNEYLGRIEANDLLAYADHLYYEASFFGMEDSEIIALSQDGYPPASMKITSTYKAADLNSNPKVALVYTYTLWDGSRMTFERYIVDGYVYEKNVDGSKEKMTLAEYNAAHGSDTSATVDYGGVSFLEHYEGKNLKTSEGKTTITRSMSDLEAQVSALLYVGFVLEDLDELTEDDYIIQMKKAEETYTLRSDGQYDAYSSHLEFDYMNLNDGLKFTINVSLTRAYDNSGTAPTITIPSLSGY